MQLFGDLSILRCFLSGHTKHTNRFAAITEKINLIYTINMKVRICYFTILNIGW